MLVRICAGMLSTLSASALISFFAYAFGAVLLSGAAAADSKADMAVDAKVEEKLRERLSMPANGMLVDSIEHSEIEGMYLVRLQRGPEVLATESGDFFIVGDLYQVKDGDIVNIAEQRRAGSRLEALAALPMEEQIVFPAEGETLAHVTVFTDVSCFYCQKLHKEVPELNRRGIEVRYLAYPRQGLGSPGFRQLATAWCADDRQNTLTRMKNRESVDDAVCPGNPVASHYELGQDFGVRGTPAIVKANGEMIPGYRSADQLMGDLGLD